MYSDICSVVQVNSYLSEPCNIIHSVHQGCPLLPLLYAMALHLLLQKLKALRGILRKLERGQTVSAYANDVTVVVPNTNHIYLGGTVLKEFEVVTGARINQEKMSGPATQHLERQVHAFQ